MSTARALRLFFPLSFTPSFPLCLLLALSACGDKDDPKGDPADEGGKGSGEGGEGGEGGDGADGADGAVDGPVLYADAALLDVSPLTLPVATGGPLTATISTTATLADGSPLSLDEAIARTRFEALTYEGAEPAEVEAEVGEDGALLLRFNMDGTLDPRADARAEARLVPILADGAPFVDVAVRLYEESDAFFEGTSAAPEGLLERGRAEGTLCHAAVVDADDDGQVELLSLSVLGDTVLLRGCAATGGGGRGGWTCADSSISISGGDLLCGDTSHFLTVSGAVLSGDLRTDRGELHLARSPRWTGAAWSGAGSSTPLSAFGLFGVVLGLNTTKEDRGPPVAAALGLSNGSGGSWTGVYQAGDEISAWEAIGDVRTDVIAGGLGWAGLFGDADLSGAEGSGASWAWSLDGRAAAARGTVTLTSASWAEGAGFARARDVVLEAPPFTVEHAAAAGEDLDGDGVPDLILEMWGEGQWAAWVVPSVTDKATTRPPVRLRSAAALNVGYGAPVTMGGDGTFAVAHSSFALGGDGVLQATFHMLKGMEYSAAGEATEQLLVGETWSVPDLFGARTLALASSGGGVLGAVPMAASTTPCSSNKQCRRQVCKLGRCGPQAAIGVGGTFGGLTGSTSVLRPVEGALPFWGETPAGDAVVLTAGLSGAPWPLLAVETGSGLREVGLGWDEAGPHLTLDGARWVNASPLAYVAVGLAEDGETLRPFVFEPTTALPAAPLAPRAALPAALRYALRAETDDGDVLLELNAEAARTGGSRPTVIAGPQIIGWRVAGGQLYLGGYPELDAGAGPELRFAEGPVAVGRPLDDPEGLLGMGPHRPGLVGLSAALPADPRLAPEGLPGRLDGWDEPVEVPFAGFEARYPPMSLVVGDGAGGAEVWLLPADDALAGASPVVWSEPGTSLAKLMVPQITLQALADAPPALLSTSAEGGAELSLTDGRGRVARTALALGPYPSGLAVSAGDINGDGLSDLIFGAGSTAAVHLSDGRGGLLEGEGPAPEARTSFGVLLGGSAEGDECAVDGDGGGLYTLGRELFGGTSAR